VLDQGTILVTGGAGVIGSALVWALNQQGCDRILVSDILDRSDKWRNLLPLRFDDYVEADWVRTAIERQTLDHVRTVLHCGACSSTTETDGSYLIRSNVEYTKMLAEWALRRDIRFVYASSAATYGACEGTVSDGGELTQLRPLNLYGFSKHLFDVWASRRGYLDRIVGLKYFNVFGPNEAHKGDMRSVVSKTFDQIRETGRVRLFKSYRPDFANGHQRRDFLYVKDAARMTLHVAAQGSVHGLLNIGSGQSHTWLDLVRPVFHALGCPERIDFIDMPADLRAKYQYSTCASIERLRQSGYERAVTPLADAVAEYVRLYLVPDHRLGDDNATATPPKRRDADT
jgi:ADP-L-glycero-D-manno-heptose 6-epimerase